MPATYALHRFGADALRRLPGQMQQPILRFRRLYNAGLHGADLFFFASPTVDLYRVCGGMTGADFFAGAAAYLKQNPSEGGTACLYGLLGWYCLYTQLSSLINEATTQGIASRVELEVELDRYLLGLDGKTPAHTHDMSPQLKMTRGECVTMAGFFPAVTVRNFYSAHRGMVRWTHRMSRPKRTLTALRLKLARTEFALQMMPDHANHKCLHLDKPMLECYDRALEMYPDMARQLEVFFRNGTPLGEEFSRTIF